MRTEKQKKYQQEWYKRNRERVLAEQKEYLNSPEGKAKRQEWLDKNRENKTQYNKKYWQENKEVLRIKNREYQIKSNDKERCRRYYHENKDKVIEYRKKNKERISKIGKLYRENNKEKIKAYQKWYNQTLGTITRHRQWDKDHPRSKGGTYSIELEIAMNNVRVRDNNTCQWQGCGKTYKDAPIHVHHIFPRHEYPDFEEIEQYMICYCLNHHALWHRYRGDDYHKFIANTDEIYYEMRGKD